MLVVEERVRGARLDPKNVFRWCKVILNLPWIFKVRKDSTLVADLFLK